MWLNIKVTQLVTVVVYFMGAFDSFTIAEGVVSIGHAKLSGCHHPISFRISNHYSFTSRLLVLESCIVGNLDERCMVIKWVFISMNHPW